MFLFSLFLDFSFVAYTEPICDKTNNLFKAVSLGGLTMCYKADKFASQPKSDAIEVYPSYVERFPKAAWYANMCFDDMDTLLVKEVGELTTCDYRDEDLISSCDRAKDIINEMKARLDRMALYLDAIKKAEDHKCAPPEPPEEYASTMTEKVNTDAQTCDIVADSIVKDDTIPF